MRGEETLRGEGRFQEAGRRTITIWEEEVNQKEKISADEWWPWGRGVTKNEVWTCTCVKMPWWNPWWNPSFIWLHWCAKHRPPFMQKITKFISNAGLSLEISLNVYKPTSWSTRTVAPAAHAPTPLLRQARQRDCDLRTLLHCAPNALCPFTFMEGSCQLCMGWAWRPGYKASLPTNPRDVNKAPTEPKHSFLEKKIPLKLRAHWCAMQFLWEVIVLPILNWFLRN